MAKVFGGEEHTVTYYRLRFLDSSKEGYDFPCDKNGNVLLNEMNKDSLLSYQYALSHPEFFKIYNEVEELSYRYRDDKYLICPNCGEKVILFGEGYYGAYQCSNCGRYYNIFGQELNDPQYWEENFDEE